MDLERSLTPALLSYEGLQYQHMMPVVFTSSAMGLCQGTSSDSLRLLRRALTVRRRNAVSAGNAGGAVCRRQRDLYEFWGGPPVSGCSGRGPHDPQPGVEGVFQSGGEYLQPEDRLITIVFGELADGRVKQKGTLARWRGEKWCAISRRAALRIWSGSRISPEWVISLRRNIPRGRSGRSCGESGLQPDCDDGRAI